MKSTSMQGDRPPDKVQHLWHCTRRGPFVEQVVREANGQASIVVTCTECNQNDDITPPKDAA